MTSPGPRPDFTPAPTGAHAAPAGSNRTWSTTAPAQPLTSDVVAIHLATACPACGAVVSVDAIVDGCACQACGTRIVLTAEAWRDVLAPIVSRLESLGPDDRLTRSTGTFRFVVGRSLACACGGALPPQAIEAAIAGGAYCPRCGQPVMTRAVPPALAALVPGITHLVGEDPGQLAGGTGAGRGFLARIDRVARAAYFPPDWGQILSATSDGAGNVYVLITERGARVGQPTLLALDPELRTRWSRRNLPMAAQVDGGLIVTHDALIAWTGDRVSALKLSPVDGRDLGRLGAQQPRDATVHSLDLRGALSVAVDVDGTFLMIKERRLARCAPGGTGLATWPPRRGLFGKKHEKLLPFGADDDLDTPTVDALLDFPTRVYRAHVRVGPDGRAYLYSGAHVTSIERDGHVRWRATLPAGWYGALGADVHGCAYVVSGKDAPGIHRIAPDGRSAALIVDGRRPETPLREDHLVVRSDGSLLVLGDGGRMRVFGGNGLLYWRSDAARFEDEEMQSRATAG